MEKTLNLYHPKTVVWENIKPNSLHHSIFFILHMLYINYIQTNNHTFIHSSTVDGHKGLIDY